MAQPEAEPRHHDRKRALLCEDGVVVVGGRMKRLTRVAVDACEVPFVVGERPEYVEFALLGDAHGCSRGWRRVLVGDDEPVRGAAGDAADKCSAFVAVTTAVGEEVGGIVEDWSGDPQDGHAPHLSRMWPASVPRRRSARDSSHESSPPVCPG